MIRNFILLLICLCLAGCGFSLRSNKDLPQALQQHVNFLAEHPNSLIAIKLRAMLQSLRVNLTTENMSHYTLKVSGDSFDAQRAEVVNANLPSTVTYTQTVTVSILDNKKQQNILSRVFSASHAITLNANQIYMPNTNLAIKETLTQALQARIYYWLTSTQTKDILRHATDDKKY